MPTVVARVSPLTSAMDALTEWFLFARWLQAFLADAWDERTEGNIQAG